MKQNLKNIFLKEFSIFPCSTCLCDWGKDTAFPKEEISLIKALAVYSLLEQSAQIQSRAFILLISYLGSSERLE